MDSQYKVATGSLRELQLLELELFKLFKSYCDSNNLMYFAMGGTLLGAVRHKGFIPWDDDIDVGMPRDDYERFIREFSSDDPKIRLRWHGNDELYTRYFARLEDSRVMVLRNDMTPPELTPAWIDIFPLDGMPSSGPSLTLKKYRVLFRRALYRFSLSDRTSAKASSNRPFYERLLISIQARLPLYRLFPFEREWEKLDECLKSDQYYSSENMINAMGHWKLREMFPVSCYGAGAMYDFEDTQIRGPIDYDRVCTSLYGDYMTPVDTGHHQTVFQ